MQTLNPCPFRNVDDEGQILCNKIKSGDRQVSPDICQSCPIAHIHCVHLRATLLHQTRPPIVVRFGNGKTEVWEGEAPTISLQQAACAAKTIPILDARDCANCPLHEALAASTVTPAAQFAATVPALARARAKRPAPRGSCTRSTPSAVQSTLAPIKTQMAQDSSLPIEPSRADVELIRDRPITPKVIRLDEWLEKQKSTHHRLPSHSVLSQ